MRILSVAVLSVVFAFAGCSKEDPSKANDQEAAKRDKEDKKNNTGIKSFTTAVKAGKVIACKDWVTDPDKFAKGLKEAGMGGKPEWAKKDDETNYDTVLLKDVRKQLKKSGLTSACDIIRPGEPPSMKKQKEMSKSSGLLGVLPGDPWCNLRAYCSIAEQKNYDKICTGKGDRVNKELGITACVRTSIMGKYDAFTYRLVDKDTKCLLEIRGGNSIRTEAKVRQCAKMAMEAFTKKTLKRAK